MAELQGKVALITGGARGIGRACALELARLGAAVAINDLPTSDAAAITVDDCAAFGGAARFFPADVGDPAALETMFAEVCASLGPPHIVVNNAYRSIRRPFLELERNDLTATWDVCLLAPFSLSQLAAREMVRRREGGHIVMISSVLAFIPFASSLPYNTAKAGLEHMAATIAAELAPHRIHVNIVEPGWIDTPGERAFCSEEEIRQGGARLPWGRLGTPEEVGRTVAFLCSSGASYVTGATLRVDGGYWMAPRG